ncbi:hypothetical protein M0R45_001692 [Rubus argutus]|uniref:Secreted protein n=1 Tax=Rubus argutus TaxID=59490 RepID=A0AAW1VGT9_RUBAR
MVSQPSPPLFLAVGVLNSSATAAHPRAAPCLASPLLFAPFKTHARCSLSSAQAAPKLLPLEPVLDSAHPSSSPSTPIDLTVLPYNQSVRVVPSSIPVH